MCAPRRAGGIFRDQLTGALQSTFSAEIPLSYSRVIAVVYVSLLSLVSVAIVLAICLGGEAGAEKPLEAINQLVPCVVVAVASALFFADGVYETEARTLSLASGESG